MAMISAKITLAFIFIFAVSQSSQHPAAPPYYKEYCIADVQANNETLPCALDWACKHGADCSAIKPGQACFEPNTTLHHASYAFNSYYQKYKLNFGVSCYFNTTAVLTASDPTMAHAYFISPLEKPIQTRDTSIFVAKFGANLRMF
ncbi:hypothetical protein CASFOL_031682 [Castilleja foliolosa]|uniref:X8 domain-containing protein n=1 Tax=Castilleja foliolosa TaxID=1961234 RepID=A0ABD3C6S4_9LAMI